MGERSGKPDFADLLAAAMTAPLTEVTSATVGDSVAALGFTLAWARMAAKDGLIVWAMPETGFPEYGVPHAEGLAQFGLTLDRLLLVRTATQLDALWASELGLTIARAVVVCIVTPARKALTLTTTRRLLLAAEKNGTRCVMLRLDAAGTTAAWTRWRIAAAASHGEASQLGPPAFTAHLERNRAGPTGHAWSLRWSAHENAFRVTKDAMAGPALARPADRPAAATGRLALG